MARQVSAPPALEVSTRPALIDIKTLSFETSQSTRKLWAMANAGEIPCVRVGRSLRFELAAVLAALKQQSR